MPGEFEICGNHIPFDNIKDYSIVQREYIYRPSYVELITVHRKMFQSYTTKEYKFDRMLPYAMILNKDDMDFKEATKNTLTHNNVGLSIAKDITVGVLSVVEEKINRRRYRCLNVADRKFTVRLTDIPAVVVKSDGRILDVYKNEEAYAELGQGIETTILVVSALRILTAGREYFFFGNGIHFDDVNPEYARLRYEIEAYKESVLVQDDEKRLNPGTKESFVKKLFSKKKDYDFD